MRSIVTPGVTPANVAATARSIVSLHARMRSGAHGADLPRLASGQARTAVTVDKPRWCASVTARRRAARPDSDVDTPTTMRDCGAAVIATPPAPESDTYAHHRCNQDAGWPSVVSPSRRHGFFVKAARETGRGRRATRIRRKRATPESCAGRRRRRYRDRRATRRA